MVLVEEAGAGALTAATAVALHSYCYVLCKARCFTGASQPTDRHGGEIHLQTRGNVKK